MGQQSVKRFGFLLLKENQVPLQQFGRQAHHVEDRMVTNPTGVTIDDMKGHGFRRIVPSLPSASSATRLLAHAGTVEGLFGSPGRVATVVDRPQDLAQLGGQCLDRERLLQEVHAFIQHPVMGDHVGGVAGYE